MTLEELSDALVSRLGDAVTAHQQFCGELTIALKPETIAIAAKVCRDEFDFDMLLDISSVDLLDHDPRFEIVYELYSLSKNQYLRLKTTAEAEAPEVPSVMSIWPAANWHEREVWDMMGIRFTNHQDLRRILMWEGYPFHPLRKDFPIEGKPTEVPGIAFTTHAPLGGGPFVTSPSAGNSVVREPRARRAGDLPPEEKFIEEP